MIKKSFFSYNVDGQRQYGCVDSFLLIDQQQYVRFTKYKISHICDTLDTPVIERESNNTILCLTFFVQQEQVWETHTGQYYVNKYAYF